MKSNSRPYLCAIASLCLAFALLPLSLPAQNATETATPTTVPAAASSDDDDERDYGWIGLIGLFGLAGLLRRNPALDGTRPDIRRH